MSGHWVALARVVALAPATARDQRPARERLLTRFRADANRL